MQIKYTHTPLNTVYEQILISTGNDPQSKPRNIDQIKEFIQKLFLINHHESILEHLTFNIIIKDISRLACEFIEHHRLASYTEKSFRKKREVKFYKGFKDTEDLKHHYFDLLKQVKPEIARTILPMATLTDIAITINARELFLMAKRLKHISSEEFKELSGMLEKMLYETVGIKLPNELPVWYPYDNINVFSFEITTEIYTSVNLTKTSNRKNEFTEYIIQDNNLSLYSIAQLRRHRISTLIEAPPTKGTINDWYSAKLGDKKGFIWKINKRNLIKFLELRTTKHAQKEIREWSLNVNKLLKLI